MSYLQITMTLGSESESVRVSDDVLEKAFDSTKTDRDRLEFMLNNLKIMFLNKIIDRQNDIVDTIVSNGWHRQS